MRIQYGVHGPGSLWNHAYPSPGIGSGNPTWEEKANYPPLLLGQLRQDAANRHGERRPKHRPPSPHQVLLLKYVYNGQHFRFKYYYNLYT